MAKQLAFYFDSSACSGCKACQVACKDRHQLESGRLWRRVYEVAGGGWEKQGQAWVSEGIAYNLSISCNHCQSPVCVEVCPTGAMHKRANGVVAIDAQRCMGCKYCSWACPYGSPQYDQVAGRMTKCDFCNEDLQAGFPPACVAACPMRALDYGDLDELQERYADAEQVVPLPDVQLTQPAFLVKPHKDAHLAPERAARVINPEEILE